MPTADEQHRQEFREFREEFRDHARRVELWIHGDFEKPGLNTRVDRLEREADNRKVWTVAAAGAVVVAVVTSFWNLLTNGKANP